MSFVIIFFPVPKSADRSKYDKSFDGVGGTPSSPGLLSFFSLVTALLNSAHEMGSPISVNTSLCLISSAADGYVGLL